MKKKKNFLEFQIISRLSYTNSARIQNRPYLHHLSTSLYQIATRFNSKNRKTSRSRLNCTTPLYYTVIQMSPLIDSAMITPLFLFFFLFIFYFIIIIASLTFLS